MFVGAKKAVIQQEVFVGNTVHSLNASGVLVIK